jgi:HPt (histidine-containing phosphotransfer) domain-containing protein
MARPAIDLEHLDRQSMSDADLRSEILALFLRQSDKLVGLMQGATPVEQRDLAHTLKGSARAIGAFDVADASEAVEEALGQGGGVTSALVALAASVSSAQSEIHRILAKAA